MNRRVHRQRAYIHVGMENKTGSGCGCAQKHTYALKMLTREYEGLTWVIMKCVHLAAGHMRVTIVHV